MKVTFGRTRFTASSMTQLRSVTTRSRRPKPGTERLSGSINTLALRLRTRRNSPPREGNSIQRLLPSSKDLVACIPIVCNCDIQFHDAGNIQSATESVSSRRKESMFSLYLLVTLLFVQDTAAPLPDLKPFLSELRK